MKIQPARTRIEFDDDDLEVLKRAEKMLSRIASRIADDGTLDFTFEKERISDVVATLDYIIQNHKELEITVDALWEIKEEVKNDDLNRG